MYFDRLPICYADIWYPCSGRGLCPRFSPFTRTYSIVLVVGRGPVVPLAAGVGVEALGSPTLDGLAAAAEAEAISGQTKARPHFHRLPDMVTVPYTTLYMGRKVVRLAQTLRVFSDRPQIGTLRYYAPYTVTVRS